MIYETLEGMASGLSMGETLSGLVGAGVVVQLLREVSARPTAWWKGPLSLVYIGAILALFFFTYAAGIKVLHT